MPMPEPVVLEDSDAFVEGLYHLLWSKNQSGEPCPDIIVPDVVIYKYQIPAYWYFTGSDGRLKRKNKAGIVNKKIHADFTRGARGPNDVVACHICVQRPHALLPEVGAEGRPARSDGSCKGETVVRYFDSRSLHHFLFNAEKRFDGCTSSLHLIVLRCRLSLPAPPSPPAHARLPCPAPAPSPAPSDPTTPQPFHRPAEVCAAEGPLQHDDSGGMVASNLPA